MTRHKPRGDGLAYDVTRGYRGELIETVERLWTRAEG